MSYPFKRGGFAQSLYAISATAKEVVGTFRMDKFGRKFRYAKAGASALSPGKLGVAAAINAAHMNEAIIAAVAVNERSIELTVTAGTAIAENQLAGGQFHINDADGEGHYYMIDSNSAISASGTSIIISLEDGIRSALTTDSEFTLVHNPCYGVVESTTLACPVGVPLLAVTANYYYWAQTGGLINGLMGENTAVGTTVEQSAATAGAFATGDTDAVEPAVGYVHGTVGVATEYKPIWLIID